MSSRPSSHLLMFHQRELQHRIKPMDPKTYELLINYRSHGGIVNCARSVIELITLYWPHSIDILRPERASVDGFRPLFFSSQGNVILFLALWFYHPTDVHGHRTISKKFSLVMAKGSQSTSERISVNKYFLLAFVKFIHRAEYR